ncbi:MAG: type II toxin-antitoxin system RelE/ParE family toxin [Pyrinomonadaceae bacterium]
MANKIVILPEFLREAKRLAKKYRSFTSDLERFTRELKKDALIGASLGGNLRKVRLAIRSKGSGKSGGARVITYVLLAEDTIYLLTIYDKSETETVPLDELKALAKRIKTESDFTNKP